jgi:hypothetical protein
MQIFTLIPLETKLLILVLSITTIAVIFLRISLYRKLKRTNSRTSRLLLTNDEEGVQPPIIDRLKKRYKKAGQNLEQVNTLALIDSVYKDEELSILNFKIQYDQVEAVTKALPNLLIAAGLIGTFWGITNNLSNISTVVTTIGQGSTDISGSFQRLNRPLQDMGIAFSTSLFGLFLGSTVILANTIWNTNIAKRQLTATLEDYLDNIYKITVEGNTRLDKAIDRMVHQQEEFLSRFHENVGRALELSFGKAANQISEECGRINKIAEYVYTNFSNAAGTISTGATTFQQAANSLDHQTKNLANSLGEFKNGVNTFGTTVAQLEKNNIVQNLDRILIEIKTTEQGFVKSTQSLLSTQQGFAQSSQSLQGYIQEIKSSNKETSQLAYQVYEGLKTSNNQMGVVASSIITGATNFERATASLINQTQIISEFVPKFGEGITSFVTASDNIQNNNIIQELSNVITNLEFTQQAFTNSTKTLQGSLAEITSDNQQSARLAEQVYHGLETSANGIKESSNTFVTAAKIINDSFSAIDLPTITARWQSIQADFSNSTVTFKQATENFQPSAQLKPATISLDIASKNIQVVGEKVATLSESNLQIVESIQTAICELDRMHQDIFQNPQSSANKIIHAHQSSLLSLKDALVNSLSSGETAHQKQLIQLNDMNQESLQRIVEVLEKLDVKINGNQQKSGWLGAPNFKLVR